MQVVSFVAHKIAKRWRKAKNGCREGTQGQTLCRGDAEGERTQGGQENRYEGAEREIKRRFTDSGSTSSAIDWEADTEGTVRLREGVAEVMTDGHWHRVPNEVWAWKPHRTLERRGSKCALCEIRGLPEFMSDSHGIAVRPLILNNEA